MNILEINTKITFNARASTDQYLPANRLIDVNNALDEIHIEILQSADGADFDDKNYTSDFPESTKDLVADQADYSLPTDLIKEKRLTVSYDGTNWYKAKPFDINESGIYLKNDYFSEEAPYYDLHDNSLNLYPTPTADVTAGLKIWMSRNMELFSSAEVTAGTKEPGFDRQFHYLIPLKASWQWLFYKLNDYTGADRIKQQIDEGIFKLKQHYSDKQRDGNMIVKAEVVDYE